MFDMDRYQIYQKLIGTAVFSTFQNANIDTMQHLKQHVSVADFLKSRLE